MKLEQVKPPEQSRALSEYRVLLDGIEVARVYKRPTTRTGFRYGRCIGQVPCHGWFLRLVSDGVVGAELGGPGLFREGYRSRKVILEDVLPRELREAGFLVDL